MKYTLPDEATVKATPSIIAVDPGREKTGVALVAVEDGSLLRKVIVPTEVIGDYCGYLLTSYDKIERIVCGNGTNHQKVFNALKEVGRDANAGNLSNDTTEEATKESTNESTKESIKEPTGDITGEISGNRVRNIIVELTDEKHTTEEARVRYFEWNPPKGLKRLMPKGMLYPPEPVDDFTAWVIGERYLKSLKQLK